MMITMMIVMIIVIIEIMRRRLTIIMTIRIVEAKNHVDINRNVRYYRT